MTPSARNATTMKTKASATSAQPSARGSPPSGAPPRPPAALRLHFDASSPVRGPGCTPAPPHWRPSKQLKFAKGVSRPNFGLRAAERKGLCSGRRLRAAQGLAAIAQRLGDVDARDALLAVEISQGACHPKRAVIAARAQARAHRRPRAAASARRDRAWRSPRAGLRRNRHWCGRLRMLQACEALGLDGGGGGDAGAHLGCCPPTPPAARDRRR